MFFIRFYFFIPQLFINSAVAVLVAVALCFSAPLTVRSVILILKHSLHTDCRLTEKDTNEGVPHSKYRTPVKSFNKNKLELKWS